MTPKAPLHRLSLGRRVLFSSILIVLGLLVLEVLARIAAPSIMGQDYNLARMNIYQRDTALSGQGAGTAREVLNPYFGWTLDPNTDPGTDLDDMHFAVNDYGFVDNESPITTREPGQTTIAVLGGSFAAEFGVVSGDQFIEYLKSHPQFNGQKIKLVRLGMAGFKQPQQLMVLNYMFALGAEYDYVINLDGFNEGVLPATDNVHFGMSIAHPRGWNARLQDVVDPQLTSVSYQLHKIRAQRQLLAKGIQNSWLKGIYLRQLIWKLRDEVLKRSLIQYGSEIKDHKFNEGQQFAVSGPKNSHANDEELYANMGDLWRNCSRQMHLLCDGKGIRYLHFLQPNQYLPNSKKLTEFERKNAFANEDHEFKLTVEACYPVLQERGKELINMGVDFVDLTQIYHDDDRTIYRDWCCHVNKTGYDLIAQAIAQKIIKTIPAEIP